jgi:hypothetical protein
MNELPYNLHEAIEGCLLVDVTEPKPGGTKHILEIEYEGTVGPSVPLFWFYSRLVRTRCLRSA